MSDETFEAALERHRRERRAEARLAITAISESADVAYLTFLRKALPTPDHLRSLSSLLDVAELREVDDPEDVASRLAAVREMLQYLATIFKMMPEKNSG